MALARTNRMQMKHLDTLSVGRWVVVVLIGLSGCAASQNRLQAAEAIPLVDDERDVEKTIEQVNTIGSACEVTPEQVEQMVAGCDRGLRDDCIRTGVAYWRGCGTPADETQGEKYLEKACGLGSLTSCRLQAQVIADGAKPRPVEAVAVLDKACKKGGQPACGDLGVVLTTRSTQPSTKDVERGVTFLLETCRAGYSVFCNRFALVIELKKLSHHFSEARIALRQACDSNYLDACWTLARTLEDGTLGSRDYVLGAKLADHACRKDHQPSCNALGYMFVRGHGVAQDPYRGAQLFYAACAEGYPPACGSMGEATEKGWGVEPDQQKALEFYQRACALGNEHSCALISSPSRAPSTPQ
jgi:uncharacterized protein